MTIRIFIDQGHNPGTVNAGASANGLEEQTVNFEVGNMLSDLLDQDCRFAVRTSHMYPQQMLGTSTASNVSIWPMPGAPIISSASIAITTSAPQSTAAKSMSIRNHPSHGHLRRAYWKTWCARQAQETIWCA